MIPDVWSNAVAELAHALVLALNLALLAYVHHIHKDIHSNGK